MTTRDDTRIDRALTELPQIPVPCSVWRNVDRNMVRLESRLRGRRRLFASLVASVASLAVISIVWLLPASDMDDSVQMRETVEAAVKQARPRAQFTGHVYRGDGPAPRAIPPGYPVLPKNYSSTESAELVSENPFPGGNQAVNFPGNHFSGNESAADTRDVAINLEDTTDF